MAGTPHVIQPGQTLSGVAAADGLTPAELAAANGLSPLAQLRAGSTLEIPSATASGASPGAPAPLGGYVVRPGDTLSAIAARVGGSPQQIAWMNGLSPSAPLLTGTALKLPTDSSVAPASTTTRPTAAAPYATTGEATASQIGSVAAGAGVPASLAQAIAWQESGFHNGAVSSANARGVMQVEPGTWSWIETNLAHSPLDPSSMTDNIRAGALYLGELLRDTGGNEALAIAAYYQGLGSVRAVGMLPSTQRYVANVLALKSRFGG